MRDFFLYIYADLFGLENAQFQLIFDHALYFSNGYTISGLIFLTFPLIITGLFYFFYSNPFAKYWHWLIALALCIVIVGSLTYQYNINLIFTHPHPDLRTALITPATGYADFARELVLQLSFINILLSAVLFTVYSLGLKQFSKAQGHIPI